MRTAWWPLVVVVPLCACRPGAGTSIAAEPGAPLPGLSQAELARFEQGRALFNRAFTPARGLGPLFNQDRCSSCHDLPTSGGTGAEAVLFATRFEPPDRCDPLAEQGGNNIQMQATPLLRALGVARERVPPAATERARITPPALFGVGMVEAIPDATILALADPGDRDRDGISGRAGRASDGRLGRFGRKAEFATLRTFIDGALRFELGVTTPGHPAEERLNEAPVPAQADPAPDPEIDEAGLDLLVEYVRLLAPLAPLEPSTGAARDTLRRGDRAFHAAGCAACHVPRMRTARDQNPALDRQWVRLYSDLLLHDLGPELAGVCGVGATPSEHRTASLVGLRYRTGLLHDGRAASVWAAVLLHGGEAAAARRAFIRLDPAARESLVAFLHSL
jgi:CxxC motif-containing protein (DUF1111 family)